MGRATRPLRHPLHAAGHELGHLEEVARKGESPATLAILLATWVAIVLPLVALVAGLAFGVSYLVTGSAGTRYPQAATRTTAPTPASGPRERTAGGRAIFARSCAACHGATGHGGVGPDLTTLPAARDPAVVVHQVTYGGGVMPAFASTLDARQIRAVTAYVTTVLATGAS